MRIAGLVIILVLFVVIISTLLLISSYGVASGVDDEDDSYMALISKVEANTGASCIVINEIMYNPSQSGTDSAYEWIELYNTCNEAVDLVGWGIRDNGGYDAIPMTNLSGYGFVVVAATDNFSVNFPDNLGTVVFVDDGRIGNGLGNEGDRLILTDESGNVIDELSYGSDTTVNSSWLKKVAEGHSMERQPAGGAFVDNANPTPGYGLTPLATPTPVPNPSSAPSPSPTPSPGPTTTLTPTVTPTPTLESTATPTPSSVPSPTPDVSPAPSVIPTVTSTPEPTATPTPMLTPGPTPMPSLSPTTEPTPSPSGTVALRGDVFINEVQYNPPQSGTDTAYEWFELYNNRDETIELVGWGIRDNGGYDAIPAVSISAHGYAVIAATDNFSVNFPDYLSTIVFIDDGRIGNGLSNEGDYLILTDGSGNIIDELSYGSETAVNSSWLKKVGEGHSMERQPAGGEFTDNAEPTPGRGLLPPESTPLPTQTSVSSPTPNPTATSTNTPTGTVADRGTILINEVQCNPSQSGSDSSYEWVEIYNPGDESVTLTGWLICDNRASDAVPDVVLQANGLVIVAASQNFSVNFPGYEGTIVFIADGRIGNGLGNGGDCLILKDSAGTTIDEISYGDDDSITSPPWPEVADGHSLERKPCGGQFVDNDAPTPGHCLPEVIGYADSAGLSQVSPMSDESDSVVMNQQQSMDLPLSATSQAHMSSSIDEPVDYHSISLSSLLFTLSSALAVILVWMLHRRKAR